MVALILILQDRALANDVADLQPAKALRGALSRARIKEAHQLLGAD